MDIDEFLDREVTDLDGGQVPEETPKSESAPQNEDTDMQSLLEAPKDSAGRSVLEETEDIYLQLWKDLIHQKLKWDKDIYDKLSAVDKKASEMLNQASAAMKNKAAQINELLNNARSALKEGKKDIALRFYSQVQRLNSSIPNVFFEEKISIQDQITNFYRELTVSNSSEVVRKVSASIQEINQLADKAASLISSNDFPNAIADYTKCTELYNQLPKGFLMINSPVGMKLLDIYKKLSIHAEISNLQIQLGVKDVVSPQPIPKPLPLQAPALPASIPKPNDYQQLPYRKTRISVQKQQVPQETAAQKTPKKAQTSRSDLLSSKIELAKKTIRKGLYDEAWNDLEEVLRIDPDDVESKALRAKIKTLQ